MGLRNGIWLATRALLALTFAIGCGSDPTGSSGNRADFGGIWEVDLVVVSKQLCDRDPGEMSNASLYIAQRGATATVLLENSVVELEVEGARATGAADLGDVSVQFDLRIVDGELTGTMIRTDNTVPCTESQSISGTRVNAAASPDFAGYWNLEITISGGTCQDIELGAIERICRRIQMNSHTIWIEDEAGVLLGVGDGNTVDLERYTAEENISVELTVTGDELSGSMIVWELEGECYVTATVAGTRRSTACDDTGSAGNFAGYWSIAHEVLSNTCGLPVEPACEQFTQDGNVVVLVDEGLDGMVEGNTLTVHAAELVDETVTLIVDIEIELSQDENSFAGTTSIRFEDSADPESNCETRTAISGTRTSGCLTSFGWLPLERSVGLLRSLRPAPVASPR